MSEPVTWTILRALQAAFDDIRPTNGYYTAIGNDVSLEAMDDPDTAPSVLVYATRLDVSDEPGVSRAQHAMEVTVEVAVPANWANAQETLHRALQDIVRAVNVQRTNCLAPAGVRAIKLHGANLDRQADGARCVTGAWDLSITYQNRGTES